MSLDITPKVQEGRQLIDSYGDGGFQIGGHRHLGAVLVFPEKTLPWLVGETDGGETEGASLASLAPVMESDPPTELLLIGSGDRQASVSPEIRQALGAAGVVIETMDTGAACRTFNVLLTEGRRVAAALIPVT